MVIFHHVLWILTLFFLSRINVEILLILIIIVQLHCVMLKQKFWKRSLKCINFFLSKVMSYSDHDKYQFGFKRQHSTTLCAGIVKQSIEYYISRWSHVFTCFVDFSKAFDKVNYWTLFKQLIDDGVNSCFASIFGILINRLLLYGWILNRAHFV